MQSGLASRVVRPVLIGRLDILGDAVNAVQELTQRVVELEASN
jgi:hypothetical protein